MASAEGRIRKQVYLLTAQDLTDHAIWEFCSDEEGEEGQDEATVKPSSVTEVPGYSPGVYILGSDVVFSDGTKTIGYIYSGEPQDLGCTQPNILVGSEQINFWFGALRFQRNLEERLAGYYRLLGKNREAIYPITFQSRADVNGSPLKIVVESFMGIDEKREVVAVG